MQFLKLEFQYTGKLPESWEVLMQRLVEIWMEYMVSFPVGKQARKAWEHVLSEWASVLSRWDAQQVKFTEAATLARDGWEDQRLESILKDTGNPMEYDVCNYTLNVDDVGIKIFELGTNYIFRKE
jgi:hypothetical protein